MVIDKKPEEAQKPPTLDELVAMPLSEAEARVQLANLDIQLAQCNQEKAEIDRRVTDIMAVRAVVLRRVLNPQPRPEASDDANG